MSRIWCFLTTVWLVVPALAELPYFTDGDRPGIYAVHEAQRYEFLMRYEGEIQFVPLQRDRDPVAVANRITLDYGIEEVRPDGETVLKVTRKSTLSSEQSATDDIRKLVVRGECTGDAVFELVIEQSQDVISLGGRVVDCGKLTAYPLRFTVRVSIPNVYRRVEIDDKQDQREFDKQTRRDYLELKRVDGSREQLCHDDDDSLDGPVLTGSGVEELEMRISYYEGRRFYFHATRGSGMAISALGSPGPWYEGMKLHWFADSTKDPESHTRLRIWIK